MESWREELYHHGIKGQKWGKKNGPPYPLDPADDYSRSEKRNNRERVKEAKSEKKEEKKSISRGPSVKETYEYNPEKNSRNIDKPLEYMTDEELRKYNQRVQQEKTYNDNNRSNEKHSTSIKKPLSEMTDQELIDFNNRRNQEESYLKGMRAASKEANQKELISTLQNGVSDARKGVDALTSAKEKRRAEEARIKMNAQLSEIVSGMSNAELKAATDRLRLERDYKDVVTSDKYGTISAGRNKTKEILETVGSVTAIAGSVVSMAIAIKEFKRKFG